MIEIRHLSKSFRLNNGEELSALKNINLTVADGEIFGVIGMSGAGKSTLVRCINLLEKPDEGTISVDGVVLTGLKEKQLREHRRRIAMVFQNFNLLEQASCLENVRFPLDLVHMNRKQANEKALELLDIVGLKEKADSYPSQLSGGQKQRVAIARALASDPKVLLCDEATSALDPTTTNSILELIQDINRRLKITVIIITHQMSVVESICSKVAILDNGEIAEIGEVSEVFSHPKTKAAMRLVFPESESVQLLDENANRQHYIRVVFNGSEAAGKPLVATLAQKENILCNIVYASLKNINERAYGSMLLGVSSQEEVLRVKEVLKDVSGVVAEEFVFHV